MIIHYIKKKLLTFFILLMSISNLYAEIVSEIIISGNQRVNSETIKIFGGISVNDDLSSNDLNNILKKLYNTNFFETVNLSLKDSVLEISVVENAIVPVSISTDVLLEDATIPWPAPTVNV